MIKVAFVCVHNSCRSQMAEGYGNSLGKNIIEVYSAGTENYPEVKPMAVKVMEDDGVDMSLNYPKLLTDIPSQIDVLITMGCNVSCPYVPAKHVEDWGLEDPSGGPESGFINTRELVKKKVIELISRVEKGEFK